MRIKDIITQREFRWLIKKFSPSLLQVMGGNLKEEFAV